MFPDVDGCPLSRDRIAGFRYVADLIYNPVETRLLAEARAAGARCVNGLFMLIAQAVRAQELWNGVTLEDGVIERIYQRMNKPPGENIVLIGMPGSGKTALGRALAAALGRTFVDLDALIESGGGPDPVALCPRGGRVPAGRDRGGLQGGPDARSRHRDRGRHRHPHREYARAGGARSSCVRQPALALIHETIDYGARPLLAEEEQRWRRCTDGARRCILSTPISRSITPEARQGRGDPAGPDQGDGIMKLLVLNGPNINRLGARGARHIRRAGLQRAVPVHRGASRRAGRHGRHPPRAIWRASW
jgi:hypothetical protein